ncbi:MAG: hypothetical protein WAK55_28005 [Xanthobacteraceae bacterium]
MSSRSAYRLGDDTALRAKHAAGARLYLCRTAHLPVTIAAFFIAVLVIQWVRGQGGQEALTMGRLQA